MIYNIIVDVICMAVVLLIHCSDKKLRNNHESDIMILYALMKCVFVAFSLDIIGLLLDGKTFKGARTMLWIVDTAYWLPHTVYSCLWLMFADYHTLQSNKHLRKVTLLYMSPMIAEVILILTNPLTGYIFTLDQNNIYTPGTIYHINLIPYFVCIVFAVRIIIHGFRVEGNESQKRCCQSMIVFMLLPVCGVVLELFLYGVMWIWPLITLSVLMVYLSVQHQYLYDEQIMISEQIEKNAVLEKKLINSRVNIMLSQIQPHFLYNVLGVIYYLCDKDPKQAKSATLSFSNYLRMNLDSLSLNAPVIFEKELEHTKVYLSLEKMRFEENLNIEYDIQTSNFMIPALTLQPLVENAVKHGLGKAKDGGTINITTKKSDNCYQVIVSDDGVGFDIHQVHNDGCTHVGIDNVKTRLKSMINADLEIKSEKGKGTIATINIPKEKKVI